MKSFFDNKLKLVLPILAFILVAFIKVKGQQFTNEKTSATPYVKGNDNDLYGINNCFIENVGQYGETFEKQPNMGIIKFGYEGFGIPVLFTPKGLIYLHRKISGPSLAEQEKEERKRKKFKKEDEVNELKVTDCAISMEWVDANLNVEVIAEEVTPEYHTYGFMTEKAHAYKKITYKNLYNGVDLVYNFITNNKVGFEYSLLVRPGSDLSKIKMRYGGDLRSIKIDGNGNLVLKSKAGQTLESIPVSYYSDEINTVRNAIPLLKSKFKLNQKEVSFALEESYDKSKSIVIDPFVTGTGNLTGTGTNSGIAKDVDFDYAGNVYVTGGGNGSIYKLAKFDATGALQWTFSGALTIPSWTFGIYYGGWVVEKTTGNIYCGQGFAPGGGHRIIRINTTGIYDNYISSPNGSFLENWKMYWQCNNGTPRLFIAGGGTNSNINFGIVTPPATTITSLNVTGIPYGAGGWAEDISDVIIDPSNNDLYTIYGSLYGTPSLSNKIYKNPSPYNGATVAWNVPSGFTVIQEIANRPYLVGPEIDNSSNVFAINSSYLFYWDGKNLKAFNKATGAGVGTPLTIGSNTNLMSGGIIADECNNIFVGSPNGIIKVYSFNGANFDDAAKPDITIPGFGTSAVYDLAFDDSQKLLYASGKGFVGSFDVSSYNCTVSAFTLNVASSCGTLSATATVSPAPPVGSTITYVLYNGTTQIATNTTGVFNGLSPNITYNIKATVNQACSGSVTTTTFTLPGPAVSPAITNTACGTSTGSIIVTAAGGTAPYTYSINGVTFQPGNSFLNLAAGLYTVTVKDVNGCSNIAQVTILNANGPTATYTKTDATCGSNTGTITASGTGGAAPLTYSINGTTFQTNNIFAGVSAGTYTLTVKDANGCTNAVSVSIVAANAPTVVGIPASTFCNTNNGSITAIGTGGTAPLQYSINGNTYQSASLFSNLTNGTYTLYTKDANGCINSVSVVVPTTSLPTLSAVTSIATCGNANGSITATSTGGTLPLQYSINGTNFQSSSFFGGLTAGTYILIVKDANGCSNTLSATVTSNNSPVVTATSTATSCVANTGTITASGSGGFGSLTYSINGGLTYQASTFFSGLAAGPYMLQVKDFNGCIGAVFVNVVTATPPTVTLTVTPTACSASNGIITAVGNGGTPSYQFKLNGGNYQASGTYSGLATGIYTVTIKDANGCSSTAQATMVNVAGLSITASNVSSSCLTASGIITANALGGAAPLQYSINGVAYQNSPVFNNVAGGTYTVYVKDANGCISTTTQTVLTLAEPAITATSTNATCAGNNATITLAGSGGTPPLQYSIDGITYLNTNIFINVAPGAYTVSVKDASGCTKSALVTITTSGAGPGVTAFTVVIKEPFLCNNETLGRITNPKVNGGTCNNCTYSLDGAAFIPNATQLYTTVPIGIHYLTVMDANGCTKTILVNMTAGVPATATYTVTGTACGTSNGSIALHGVGVNTPFHASINGGVTWNNFGANFTYSALAPGIYSIILEDDASFNGGNPWHCYDTITVIVPAIGGPSINTSKTNGTCHQNDGSITVTSTGGTLPLTYNLNGGAYQSSNIFSNLSSGIYTINVKDGSNCINTKIDTILNPDGPTLAATPTPTSCGNTNGIITATGAGGNAPLQYSINGTVFQTSNVFTGLSAGTYTVTVLDAMLCFETTSVTITAGTFPKITAFSVAATCNSNNGAVVASGTSGTAPYQYSLDGITFQSSNMFTGLAAGPYDITIKDANGCINSTTLSVGNIAAPTLSLASTQATCGNANGTITVTGAGGTAPLQYSVDGITFQPANVFNGLAAGSYAVYIKDANGCQNSKNILISSPIAPQTLSASVTAASCGNSNGIIVAAATGGVAALTFSINNTNYQTSTTFNGLAAGSYPLTVKDANGCLMALPINVINLSGPSTTAVSTLSSCFANDGTITANGTGGTGLLQYSKNGITFQSSPVFTALAPGTYTITTKDAKGCITTTNVTVSQVTGPHITALDSTSVCGDNIVATGTIGQPAYQYNINNNSYQNSNVFPCLTSGAYIVRVKDANGCLDSVTLNIVSPLPIELISFTGHVEKSYNKLEWVTASELNSDYFTIEKSKDGKQFNDLAIVNAAGESHSVIRYNLIDDKPFKNINYYRLKQTDLNGDYVYSKTISLQSKSTGMFDCNYNAADNQLIISCNDCKKESTTIILIDAMGRIIYSSVFSDSNFIASTYDIAKGAYTIQLKSESTIETFKLVIY